MEFRTLPVIQKIAVSMTRRAVSSKMGIINQYADENEKGVKG